MPPEYKCSALPLYQLLRFVCALGTEFVNIRYTSGFKLLISMKIYARKDSSFIGGIETGLQAG
jgi:hypothetical protein